MSTLFKDREYRLDDFTEGITLHTVNYATTFIIEREVNKITVTLLAHPRLDKSNKELVQYTKEHFKISSDYVHSATFRTTMGLKMVFYQKHSDEACTNGTCIPIKSQGER